VRQRPRTAGPCGRTLPVPDTATVRVGSASHAIALFVRHCKSPAAS
jgi:hypothetical protein